MKRNTLLFAFLFGLSQTGCKSKNDSPNQDLQAKLQGIVNQYNQKYKEKFPGKTIGFGLYVKQDINVSNPYNKDVYISAGFPNSYGENVHFRGASTTKTFTAADILKLSQENQLNLDDLITANMPGTNEPYIPNTSGYNVPYKNQITIRLLLQHRAGVFDVTNTNIPSTVAAPYAGMRYFDYVMDQQGENYTFSFPEMINVVAENQLSYFAPGTAFHYSNTGYNLLATIIERVSGKRYHEYLQDAFLTPLHMSHTHFPHLGTDQQMPNPYVSGWLKFDNNFIEIDKNNVSFAVSEGNIITTPADLAIWANALYATNTILNANLHTQMITGIPTNEEHVNYGLGTELNPADIGYGHNGARPAYMTIMRYHPQSDASYIMFCNFLDADDLNGQGEELNDLMRQAIKAVQDAK